MRFPALFLLGSLLLAAAPAGATVTRVAALGEGSAFFEDDRGVMRWYGSLSDYPDLLVIESGRFTAEEGYMGPGGRRVSGPGGGVHLRFDEAGTWGTAAVYYHARGDDADPGSLHRGFLGDNVSVLWNRDFGMVTAGLVWREYGEDRFAAGDATVIRSRREIGGGLRIDLADHAYLDLAGEARRLGENLEGIDPGGSAWNLPERHSWDNVGLRARVFWGISPRLVLVPLVEHVSEDDPGYDSVDGKESLSSGHLWRLGCGLQFLKDPDNLVVLSADFVDGRVDHEVSDNDSDPALRARERYRAFLARAGLEKRLAFWLTGRFSVGFEHLDNSGDFPDPATGSQLLLSGGAGFQLADLSLDLALASREPRGAFRYSPATEPEEDHLWMSLSFSWDF